MSKFIPTIGLEIHLELKTNAKVFSNSLNDYNSGANQNINEVDLAYPGVLPMVNKGVIEKAIAACFGLNLNISRYMHFDRKNYFYPDLTKGYQITQMETPIGYDGYLEIEVDGIKKKIGIERAHIEEDTAKSMHHKGKTLLNYNRCGVPLLEIVSKPDMHSKEEVIAYVERLKETMYYLDVSDCKMEEGSMRCDINISISEDENLGTRTEIKNVSSISSIGDAIDAEIKRQEKLLNEGKSISIETRRYDEDTKETVFMRLKDSNTDYRYFPEPDIPFLTLEEDMILNVKKGLNMLPDERRNLYEEKGISKLNIDKLIANKMLSDYLNEVINDNIDFTIASNILLGDISGYLNKNNISIFDTRLTYDKFIELVNALSSDKISSKIFKSILDEYLETDKTLDSILEEKGLVQINSEDEIKSFVEDIVSKYPDSVNDYKNGKDNAIKFLMGMVMKESKGKINPRMAGDILKDILDK